MLVLSSVAALSFAGCKTIYSDTYKWKRNHYKPMKETSKSKDLLLPPSPSAPEPAMDAPIGLPPAPAGMPDAAAPMPAAPAIPGL